MKLHTWQQPNVDRVTRLLGTGSRCVADTSGTGAGKTPMALFACRNASLRPTIICPLAVVPSWRETLGKLGIEGDVMHYEGLLAQARKDKSPLGKWFKKPLPAKEGVRKRRRQGTWGWTLPDNACLVFDEAHRLNGERSDVSQLLIAATNQRIPRLLLSATLAVSPLKFKALGHAFGLYSDPKHWFNWCQFQAGCSQAFFGGLEFKDRGAWEKIRNKVGNRIDGIDTSKIEGFPKSTLLPMSVPGAKNLDSVYAEELQDLKDQAESACVEALRGRQLSELGKVPAMVELTLEATNRGHSVPIFVNFTATREELVSSLRSKRRRSSQIYGGQSQADRALAESRFQGNADTVVIVMASAGGTGLDSLSDIYGRPRTTIISPSADLVTFLQVLGRCPRANSKSSTDQMVLFTEGCEYEQRVKKALETKADDLGTLLARDLEIVL
jgi:hypothetical protein